MSDFFAAVVYSLYVYVLYCGTCAPVELQNLIKHLCCHGYTDIMCCLSPDFAHALHNLQVLEVIGQNRDELLDRRYSFPVGKLMGAVREKLKWADGKLIKENIEKQVCRLYRRLH